MTIYYKVLFLDENGNKRIENGLINTDRFIDAVVKIEEYYGSDLWSIEHLEYCDRNMITLPIDICQRFVDEEDFSYEHKN
jgi:hypothetical protein